MGTMAVVGGQYGDEGKGKFVHYLVHEERMDIVGRGNGGPNAGHNVHDPELGIDIALHLMPSGIFAKHAVNIVGDGTVMNPHLFVEEMDIVEKAGAVLTLDRLKLSSRVHIILETHRRLDKATDKVGSTAQGIGLVYRDKATRTGIRLESMLHTNFADIVRSCLEIHNEELVTIGAKDMQVDVDDEVKKLEASATRLKPYICDTVAYINDARIAGCNILAEGAQATMLDINHGTYPYVTSSSATAGGIVLGLGLPPTAVDRVVGVFKLPMTRVGKGPFTTLLTEDEHELHVKLAGIQGEHGSEFGATTGRARSIGWMDLVMAKYAHQVNGFTDLGLTKLDMLSGIPELKIAVAYELDGEKITIMPVQTEDIERCTPVYEILPGWDEDISGISEYSKLPENAKSYVQFIEDYVGVPVTMIGTGPDNADLIKR